MIICVDNVNLDKFVKILFKLCEVIIQNIKLDYPKICYSKLVLEYKQYKEKVRGNER